MKQTPGPLGVLDLQSLAGGSCAGEPVTLVLPAGLELRIVTGGCVTRMEGGKKAGKTLTLDDPTSPSPRRDGGQSCVGQPPCTTEPVEAVTIALPVGLEIRLIVGASVKLEHSKKCGGVVALDDPTSPSPRRDGVRATVRAKVPNGAPARKPSPRG